MLPAKDIVSNYPAYVGAKLGTKADPSKSPITFGWLNQQGGPTDIDPNGNPTKGAQLAVNYINNQLGGIDGHPLKMVSCYTSTSDSQGQQCAEQFLNNKSIVAIVAGAEALGDQPFHQTINGALPTIMGVSSTPADGVAKHTYILYGDQADILAPLGTYARDVLHAKSAAVVYSAIAGLTQGATAIQSGLSEAGIHATKVGVSPTASDLIAPLTAAGISSTNLVAPLADPKTCVNIEKALTQIGYKGPTASTPTCLSQVVTQALGDFPKWTYYIASSLIGDKTDPSWMEYSKLLAQAGESAIAADPWPEIAFGQVLTLAKFMNALGPTHVTPAGIEAKLQAFKGPLIMGAPTINCGGNPAIPAACSFSAQFFNYHGKGDFTRAAGWLGPPK
jgi:branched-chain amino acid transport system substrate-binding protein